MLRIIRKIVCSHWQVRSAGYSGGFLHSLQVLHVHVLLVAPLGLSNMTQVGTHKHESGVSVQAANHSRPPANLAVEPLQDVVRPDACPMLGWEVGAGQRFLHAVLDSLGRLRQPHGPERFRHLFRLFPAGGLALLGVDRIEHPGHCLHLGPGNGRKNVPVKMDGAALVLGVWVYFTHGLQHPQVLVTNNKFNAVQPRPWSHWKKLTQLDLSSFIPLAAPRASR